MNAKMNKEGMACLYHSNFMFPSFTRYIYDEETGLYYLKNRYYNPIWNRFCNKDSYLGKASCIFSHNLFSYCLNSPVLRYDPFGRASQISVGFVFADDTKLYRNNTFLKYVPLSSMYSIRCGTEKNNVPVYIIDSNDGSEPKYEEYVYQKDMIVWFGFSEAEINGFCKKNFRGFFDTPYKGGYYFLNKGNNYGNENAAVQVMLKMYFTYYSPTSIDINICAAFEDNMLLAVEEFQRQEGLEVDGIFGRGSYLRLVSRLKELKDITWGINDLQ